MSNSSETNAATFQDVDFKSNYDHVASTFDQMNLKEPLLRGIYAYNFKTPSAIQSRAIVPITEGRDIICQAQSGSGKTGAFCISILQRIDTTVNSQFPQALIIAPTRELAVQSNDVLQAIGARLNVRSRCCIGGLSSDEDAKAIYNGVHVIVATPGRAVDLIERGALSLKSLIMFCIDEADQMLSEGFTDQILSIFKELPSDVQVMLVSATISQEIHEMSKNFLRDPVHILIKNEDLTLQGIRQMYIDVQNEEWKIDCLTDLYSSFSAASTVIFCNTRAKAEMVAQHLRDNKHSVSVLHGDMTQKERNQIMTEVRGGVSRVLVATNLIARGIDVQHITLVINFDLPSDNATYLHRIGRSGRYGRKGTALNLVTNREIRRLREIEQFFDCHIEECTTLLRDLI